MNKNSNNIKIRLNNTKSIYNDNKRRISSNHSKSPDGANSINKDRYKEKRYKKEEGTLNKRNNKATNKSANKSLNKATTNTANKSLNNATNNAVSNNSNNKRPTNNKRGRRKNRLKVILRILIICFITFAIIIGISILATKPLMNIYYQWQIDKDVVIDGTYKIKNNILIDGATVGGKNKDEILKQLKSDINTSREGNAISFKSPDGNTLYEYSFDDLEVTFDLEGAVDKALSFASDVNSPNWWREFKTLEAGTYNIPVMTYNKAKLTSYVNAIADEIYVKATNATMTRSNGQFVVTNSKKGKSIDKEAILNKAIEQIENKKFGEEIILEITEVEPEYDEKIFNNITGVIGSYTSNFTPGDDNRIQNLRNGCNKINGVVVYPGEVFSTNAHFNPCTEANGWASAGTIVNGKIEDSIGGGMCQVSSALYQALLRSELKITERHNHSMKVGYANYAFDATLAGDYKDLKFQNDTDTAVYIESYITSGSVIIHIYGKEIHSAGRTLEFENKFIKSVDPPAPTEKYDNTLPEGTRKLDMTALKGVTYELYKKIYENGVLIDTVKVNTSTYSPRRQVTLIGTKKP